MSDSGSEAGERPDREVLHDAEEDEERGHRRNKKEGGEREEEGSKGLVASASNEAITERTECCAACLSKNRNNGRSCICQVPARQRRAPLGAEGCVTCKCTGCHPEDILSGNAPKSEIRSYHEADAERHRDKKAVDGRVNGGERERRHHERESSRERDIRYEELTRDMKERERKEHRGRDKEGRRDRGEDMGMMGEDVPLKNGCCRPCMKAFSETKRSCLCQVPVDVRMGHLPEAGCKVCGCHGCHPEEKSVRRGIYPAPHINPYTRAPMPSGGYLPPPLPYYPPPILPLGRSRDPRDPRDSARDFRDPRERDGRDGRDPRDLRDPREREMRDRDSRDFHLRDPHLDDRRGGLLPFPPPFPYPPLGRPEYPDPYRADPRYERDGLYGRDREARERGYPPPSSHREDRLDRDRGFDRSRGHGDRDREAERERERERERAREHERERERERERRDRDRNDHEYRKRERTREADHYSRDSKRTRDLL